MVLDLYSLIEQSCALYIYCVIAIIENILQTFLCGA